MRVLAAALTLSALVGCATLSRDSFDDRFGAADPQRYDQSLPPAPGGVGWRADVQPILQRRCVVCHGCYDAPCQLKLGAWQGVARGASRDNVYDTERLQEAAPTRLFVDAQLPSQWRAKGFFPVLNERSPTPEAQLAGSLLYQTLLLKQRHPLPPGPVLGEGFDFSLDRAQSCPRVEQFEAHARQSPLAGMPYGLPGLQAHEFDTLARWLQAGAAFDGDLPLTAVQQRAGAGLGGFPERRLEQGAADEPLPVRAPVPGPPALRRRCHAPRLPSGAVEHAAGPADAAHRVAPAVRRPRRRALLVPARARARSHPGQDPHALCAEPGAHGQVPALVPRPTRCASASCRPMRSRWRATPSSPSAQLPVDARYRFLLDEAAVLHHELHQGPGVPRADGGGRHRGPLLGRASPTPRPMPRRSSGDLLLRQAEQLTLPAAQGSDSGLLAAVAAAWRARSAASCRPRANC